MSAQRQISVDHLLAICDILYSRASGEASRPGPLMVTLPMEVVTVSIQVTSVSLSLMISLELMLEIPGAATSSMGRRPTGSSRSTSTSLGTRKQVVTPAKPWGGVSRHASAKACTDGEG